ncbi:MAG: hypothetical protein OXG53_16160 [Chloroflexi bacterium]|nr:hypothetical protein [Chloroflexota bacterium]
MTRLTLLIATLVLVILLLVVPAIAGNVGAQHYKFSVSPAFLNLD